MRGRIDIEDGNSLYFLNLHFLNKFGVSIADFAKDRTAALKGIGDRLVWDVLSTTISKRMHDWAHKVGFDWGQISSHSNRGGKDL
jgi:hypothetical protein